MKKRPRSLSRIRSVTFNNLATENNTSHFCLSLPRRFAAAADSLKRRARGTSKREKSERRKESRRSFGTETQPVGPASGLHPARESRESRHGASCLRNSGRTADTDDAVQFARPRAQSIPSSLFSSPPSFYFSFLFNSATALHRTTRPERGWLYCRTCASRYCPRRT